MHQLHRWMTSGDISRTTVATAGLPCGRGFLRLAIVPGSRIGERGRVGVGTPGVVSCIKWGGVRARALESSPSLRPGFGLLTQPDQPRPAPRPLTFARRAHVAVPGFPLSGVPPHSTTVESWPATLASLDSRSVSYVKFISSWCRWCQQSECFAGAIQPPCRNLSRLHS